MRRVTKTGARFHVTDFWGEVYTPRQASVLMVSWVSSRSVRAPPPARPTRGGPSLRMAFGSQYPHTHTHTLILLDALPWQRAPWTMAGRPGQVREQWLAVTGCPAPQNLAPRPVSVGTE